MTCYSVVGFQVRCPYETDRQTDGQTGKTRISASLSAPPHKKSAMVNSSVIQSSHCSIILEGVCNVEVFFKHYNNNYYYYYIVTMRLSGTVMEIWRLKDMHTDTQTERRTHGQNDQSHNLLQCSLRYIGGVNKLHAITV